MGTTPVLSELIERRRARLCLAGLTAGALLAGLLIALLIAELESAHPSTSLPGTTTPGDGGWDWSGENALASRPMPYLPLQAAAPQTLTTPAPGTQKPPLDLPAPRTAGGWIATGFPDTPQGALAQLIALDTQGLRGADPAVYQRAYASLSVPGSPAPETARLSGYLVDTRTSAKIAPTGPVADLSFSFAPTHGLVKGVLDDGRYTVVCVLGEYTADYQGRMVSVGLGDCQAMRFLPDATSPTAGNWRISPGPAAAPAPDAWPGSQDALTVGYQEISP
jgi:hypothetical protein